MDRKVMYENLQEFKWVMDLYEVPFIIIFGALLGLVRDKDLIEYDNDVDVCCFREHKFKIMNVISEMQKRGFELQDNTPEHDTNFIRKGEKIEIWWFDNDGEKWIYDNNIQYDRKYFDNAREISFLDKHWLIPSDTEKFLDITYGTDWRIPNKNKGYILRGSE